MPPWREAPAESEAGWLTLFRGLNDRGLSVVKLVTSDAHSGLVAALAGRRRRSCPRIIEGLPSWSDG